MSKILILGGNGFIGKQLTEKLRSDNDIVVADYNIEHTVNYDNVFYKKIDFINCKDFKDYLDGIDIVIHLISTITPNEDISNINKELNDNVFSTINLLNDMAKYKNKKIVFVSSGGTVYGEHDLKPIHEYEAGQPICNYGITKELIEKYLHLYFLYHDIDYRIIRLANPYSEFTKAGKKQGIIPIFIDQIMSNGSIKIFGDGNNVRDYIYISDALDAIEKIINYNGSEKIFNVGTGIGYSQNDIIGIIKDELHIDNIVVDYLESRKCDVVNNVLDITKSEKELNWKPMVDIRTGIHKVIDAKRRQYEDREQKQKQ